MDFPDYLGNKRHSERLAERIRAYWLKRGKEVNPQVLKEGNVYVIRTANFQGPPTQPARIHD